VQITSERIDVPIELADSVRTDPFSLEFDGDRPAVRIFAEDIYRTRRCLALRRQRRKALFDEFGIVEDPVSEILFSSIKRQFSGIIHGERRDLSNPFELHDKSLRGCRTLAFQDDPIALCANFVGTARWLPVDRLLAFVRMDKDRAVRLAHDVAVA